jgi:hypothetical protein
VLTRGTDAGLDVGRRRRGGAAAGSAPHNSCCFLDRSPSRHSLERNFWIAGHEPSTLTLPRLLHSAIQHTSQPCSADTQIAPLLLLLLLLLLQPSLAPTSRLPAARPAMHRPSGGNDPSAGAGGGGGASHPLPQLAEGHPLLSPTVTGGGTGDDAATAAPDRIGGPSAQVGDGGGGGSSAAAAVPFVQRGRSELDETEFINARHDPIGPAGAAAAAGGGGARPPPRLQGGTGGPRVSRDSGFSQPTSPPAQHAEARAVMAAAAAQAQQQQRTGAAAAAPAAGAAGQRPLSTTGFLSGLLGGLRSAAPSPAPAARPSGEGEQLRSGLATTGVDGDHHHPDDEQARAASRLRRRRRRTTAPGGPLPEEAMHDELLTAAAIEFALYSAMRPLLLLQRGPAAAAAKNAAHAPARRIARTLVCLGRADGLPFGALALRHMRATALARRSDLASLAFWWSNACHLRGFLQSLSLAQQAAVAAAAAEGGGGGELAGPHWAAAAFVPALRAQERALFGEIVEAAWSGALLPAVAARSRAADKRLLTQQQQQQRAAAPPLSSSAAASSAPAHTPPPPPPPEDGALRRWTDCLDEVLHGCLSPEALGGAGGEGGGGGGGGHVPALRARALLELLRRVDALLLHHLLEPPPLVATATTAASVAGGATEGGAAATAGTAGGGAAPASAAAAAAAAARPASGWRAIGGFRSSFSSSARPASVVAADPQAPVSAAPVPVLSPAMLPWPVVALPSGARAAGDDEAGGNDAAAPAGGGGIFASLRRSSSPPLPAARAPPGLGGTSLPPLTRATGLALRAAADRLQRWALEGPAGAQVAAAAAEEEHEEEEQQAGGGGGGGGGGAPGPALFPLLRGVADLLLASPKSALADPAARRAACPGLPPGVTAAVAARFVAADEDGGGRGFPADKAMLAWRREAAAGAPPYAAPPRILLLLAGLPSSTSSFSGERLLYVPPSDDAVMEAVEAGEEPGLEYGEQSEDELDALERLTAGGGGGGGGGAAGGNDDEWWWPGVPLPAAAAAQPGPVLRFRLLHNLWSAGVPRSVRPPTAEIDVDDE